MHVTGLKPKLGVGRRLSFWCGAGSAIRTNKQYAEKASGKNENHPEKTEKVWE
ncbi:MAG: hypothetical protein QXK33_01065 [Candidatus Bathyarchaeia archaeon]